MAIKLDQGLHDALRQLPPFPFLKLLNSAKAATFDVAGYHRALADFEGRIDGLARHPIIARLYREKIAELGLRADCIAGVQRGDAAEVTRCSLALYGQPAYSRDELERHLEHMCQTAGKKKTSVLVWIDATLFAEMACRLLAAYGLDEWRVKVVNRSKLQVGHGKRTQRPVLRIPATLRVSRKRAAQLLAHEVESHVLRHANGRRSPLHILERGTAGYLAIDEGIAMVNQQRYSKNTYHLPGFWEAYAVSLALEFDRQDTERRLAAARTRLAERMSHPAPDMAGRDAAKRLCKRVYRGLPTNSPTGCAFVRDHVYLSGYRAVQTWLATHDVGDLYLGHLGINDIHDIRQLGIVTTIAPRFMSKDIVREVVQERKTSA